MYGFTQEQLDQLTPEQKGEIAKAGMCDRSTMIKRLLESRGLTPADIAREYNRPPSSVYACIDGRRPLPEIRKIVADKLGFPEWVLFGPLTGPGPDKMFN